MKSVNHRYNAADYQHNSKCRLEDGLEFAA